ncbi:hypothetical protein PGTUg99_020910 [Puccinia graminis f. sp. tritici]|uniref:DUF6589 domain-containing protein n=1 Tax=Puccinia graminis f. sp. tritici TaxID=56615 RepID=A0A5B0PL52_PUCGR|nr:hypothetical protein PGTUg99_020910 [Puccinia graminis f. sp. tritici]
MEQPGELGEYNIGGVDEINIPEHDNLTRTEGQKLLHICMELQKMKMTPKEFITAFLQSNDPKIAYRRRYWRTETGLKGTMEVVQAIKMVTTSTTLGTHSWKEFISNEASCNYMAVEILLQESPPSGYHPNGSFYSSQEVEPSFFTHEAALEREKLLSEEHMPFLYSILKRTMNNGNRIEDDNNDSYQYDDPDEDRILELEGSSFESVPSNRRHNGLQLFNSVRFVSAGLSEQMNDYLHFIGITSCRQTAIAALTVLSSRLARDLKTGMKLNGSFPLGTSICIDNLDMEQRVHTHSVGHRSLMFHGTWGYIHHPPSSLLATVNHDELTLDSYYKSLSNIPNLKLRPSLLMPTLEEDLHYEAVLKSQIARVMFNYIAQPLHKPTAIPMKPPPIDVIDPSPPKIQMLKLMEASDNSAEGFGQVVTTILNQTGLSPEEFFSRLQLIDGDLGTSKNFNSIRALRTPSKHNTVK